MDGPKNTRKIDDRRDGRSINNTPVTDAQKAGHQKGAMAEPQDRDPEHAQSQGAQRTPEVVRGFDPDPGGGPGHPRAAEKGLGYRDNGPAQETRDHKRGRACDPDQEDGVSKEPEEAAHDGESREHAETHDIGAHALREATTAKSPEGEPTHP